MKTMNIISFYSFRIVDKPLFRDSLSIPVLSSIVSVKELNRKSVCVLGLQQIVEQCFFLYGSCLQGW